MEIYFNFERTNQHEPSVLRVAWYALQRFLGLRTAPVLDGTDLRLFLHGRIRVSLRRSTMSVQRVIAMSVKGPEAPP